MAILYYAGNRLTGVSGDTKPTSNVLTGTTFLETNTDDLYMWDSDSWNIVAGNSIAETFSNKSFTSAGIQLVESSAPGTPASGFGVVYVKTDNKIYFKNDSGIEYNLTESAAGTLLDGLEDTTITSPTDGAIIAWDTGTSRWRDATVSGTNTLSDTGVMSFTSGAITDLSATATVSNSNDFVMMYDASASGIRKVTVGNIVAGGVSSDTIALLNDTTIASVASANVLIYDGTDSWDNKAISGGATINTSGVLTLAASQTGITAVGALDAGSITSNFGTINNGSSNITTTGTISAGNLTVTGTTTTVNSTVLTVVDPIIHLQTASGGGALGSDTNKDVGLAMQYYSGSAKTAFLGFDDSAAKLTFIPDATLSSEVVSGSVGTLVANLEGNVSGGAYTGTVINDDYIDTINNANKVALTALDIDGGTEIGAAIVDADLFIIDDGAGGTNRKVLASRIATYATASAASESFAIAMAVAL